MLLARRNSNWLPDVFNDFFDTDFLPKVNSNTTAPAINVIEKKDEYDVELAAPGMTKEDFKVSLDEDHNLVVELDKKDEKTEENKENEETGHYLRREFSYTKYEQTLILPDDVNKEQIAAKVENGVLTVDLPKIVEEKVKVSRQISID